jgi:hypothetical protein
VGTGQERATLEVYTTAVSSVALSGDRTTRVLGGEDGGVKIWMDAVANRSKAAAILGLIKA